MDANLHKTDIALNEEHPYRVGILLIPGFALMSYASTVEPLRAANVLSGRHLYDVVHFGAEDVVQSSGAARVARQVEIGTAPPLDLLLVVAGGDPFAIQETGMFRWLRRLARRGVRIGGVSGGPVVLVQGGLMGGRRLTVHWEHAAALADQFPDIVIERRLFVIDRDRVTCGGGTAALDLMHALISEQHGAAFAQLVSDWFLHTDIRAASAPQRGGEATDAARYPGRIAEALNAMESHVGDPLSLSQISLIAGTSSRHLNRLFVEVFGQSVMARYRDLRLSTAQRLVRSTAMTVSRIAEATGFANAGHLSNAYVAHFGVRPRADRHLQERALRGAGRTGSDFPRTRAAHGTP